MNPVPAPWQQAAGTPVQRHWKRAAKGRSQSWWVPMWAS